MHDHASSGGLGAAVKQRREALGLKQVELAEMAECSTRFVHSLESDKATMRLDKLLAVLRVLGLRLRLEPGRDFAIDPRLTGDPA